MQAGRVSRSLYILYIYLPFNTPSTTSYNHHPPEHTAAGDPNLRSQWWCRGPSEFSGRNYLYVLGLSCCGGGVAAEFVESVYIFFFFFLGNLMISRQPPFRSYLCSTQIWIIVRGFIILYSWMLRLLPEYLCRQKKSESITHTPEPANWHPPIYIESSEYRGHKNNYKKKEVRLLLVSLANLYFCTTVTTLT